MTENEIMKALECHKETDIETCCDCPMLNIVGCTYQLSGYALDLLNRKNAEIEALREYYAECQIAKEMRCGE